MKNTNRVNTKGIIIIISVLILFIGGTIAGCLLLSNNNDIEAPVNGETTTIDPEGLEANQDEYIMVEEEVTDANGEAVTDANGDKVTEDVLYKVTTDKKGNKVIAKVDDDGNIVMNDKNEMVTLESTTAPEKLEITVKTSVNNEESQNVMYAIAGDEITITYLGIGNLKGWSFGNLSEGNDYVVVSQKDKVITIKLLNKNVTTISVNASVENEVKPEDMEYNGQETELSQKEVVKSMLEVPYLYEGGSYGWGEAVPTASAAHVAIWMAQREGLNTDVYASGTIVLGLFKFYGQTVVNFKNNCNGGRGTANITYNNSNDSFAIPSGESSSHTVDIKSIKTYKPSSGGSEDHNYYKVTASVSGGKYSSVTAIIEENKLEPSLGYSIKSLQWS